MPIRLMRLIVPLVSSRATTTPIKDSGCESITANGAVKELNWITSTRYMRKMPANRPRPSEPNTSAWSLDAPPSLMP